MKKVFPLLFFIFVVLLINLIIADNQTIQGCGGDGESSINCLGDNETTFFGSSGQNSPTLTIVKPENETYLTNISLQLNFIAINQSYVWYNLDSGSNTTITGNTTFNTSSGLHTLYLFANNSGGTTGKNVTFTVNLTKLSVNNDNYNGQGSTTDFNASSYEDLQNLSGIILEIPASGKIVFNEPINVTNDSSPNDNSIDLSSHTTISSNFIEINTDFLPNFNKSATLSLYGLSFTDPTILRNGELCPSDICTEVSYSSGTLVFNVTQFSNYSAQETSTGATTNVGSGSGNTVKYECFQDSQCSSDQVCLSGQCVKLFDVKIVDYDSPVKLGEFFDFTYYIKGMANINNDVQINFWIENSTQKITSGTDTVYMGNFEEKTEKTKLFLPSNIKSGVYQFFVEVAYEKYSAKSSRTIEIDIDENGIAKIKNIEPLNIPTALIIAIILIIIFAGSGFKSPDLRKSEHKLKIGFNNLIRTHEIGREKERIQVHNRRAITSSNPLAGIKLPQIKVLPTAGFGQVSKPRPQKQKAEKIQQIKPKKIKTETGKTKEELDRVLDNMERRKEQKKQEGKTKEELDKILDDLEKEKK